MWNIILYKEQQFEVERLHPCSCLVVLCMTSNGLCNEGVGSTILLFFSIDFVFEFLKSCKFLNVVPPVQAPKIYQALKDKGLLVFLWSLKENNMDFRRYILFTFYLIT